jgi:ribonuclease P protein component
MRHRIEFEQAFRAQKVVNPWFTIYVGKNKQGVSRLGIAASKKIMPTAVSRNLAKRLIREVFRQTIFVQGTVDLVVVPRRAVKRETLPESRQALRQLLQGV